jgi:hypothetical protein
MRELLEAVAQLRRRVDALERQERPAPVAAVYNTAAGQSVTTGAGGLAVVDFGTQEVDTHGAVTTGAGWQFAAPLAGSYLVTATIAFTASNTWAETDRLFVILYKNGAEGRYLDLRAGLDSAALATIFLAGGVTVLPLAAGDVVDVRVRQDSGGTLALLNNPLLNTITIFRIH